MNKNTLGIIFASLAAVCYSLINPINKLFSADISPLLCASLLYFGTFLVGGIILLVKIIRKKITKDQCLTKKDIPNLVLAIGFHLVATISLMFGIRYVSSSNASLLGSFEIVSTSLLAYFLFKEKISKYLWIGIVFIFAACLTISIGDVTNFDFSIGIILCLISPICFGFASNFLKKISHTEPAFSVTYMGLSGGIVCLAIALIIGERFTTLTPVIVELSLGMVAYGLALILFIYAERHIGASKTSAFFSLAPFIAIILSLIIFQEIPTVTFFIGLGLLIIGLVFASLDAIYRADKA